MGNYTYIDYKDYSWQLYELYDRFINGRLIFPDTVTRNNIRDKNIKQFIKAISVGALFSNILFLELQTGQLLVVECPERLKSIFDYFDGKCSVFSEEINKKTQKAASYFFDDLPSVIRRNIKTTVIQSRIIRYGTPAYMQLFISEFMQELSVSHMEAIRHKIYRGRGIEEIKNAIRNVSHYRYSALREYEFIVFLTYIANFIDHRFVGNDLSQYQMQERTLDWIKDRELIAENMYSLFIDLLNDGNMNFNNKRNNSIQNTINSFGSKYLNIFPANGHIIGLAVAACGNVDNYDMIIDKINEISNLTTPSNIRYDRELNLMLRETDLSYSSLNQIIEYIS